RLLHKPPRGAHPLTREWAGNSRLASRPAHYRDQHIQQTFAAVRHRMKAYFCQWQCIADTVSNGRCHGMSVKRPLKGIRRNDDRVSSLWVYVLSFGVKPGTRHWKSGSI
ncbi:MAG: hypothetical protein H6Q32_1289, partial [Bacteroidetes bacterium]|nr:hypothetical protein [Bacteroidota bacterium]